MVHSEASKGVAIQIGLYTEAEYSYLLQPDWQHVMQEAVDELKHIPEIFESISDWHFIGIDCDPGSILCMRERFPDTLTTINALVTGNIRGIVKRYLSDAFHIVRDIAFFDLSDYPARAYLMPQTPFDEIVSSLGLCHIDVLAVDIEGGEVELFENYSWEIAPRFLAIEFHDCFLDMARSDFEKVILDKGYTKIREAPTNYSLDANTYHTTELQFLRI